MKLLQVFAVAATVALLCVPARAQTIYNQVNIPELGDMLTEMGFNVTLQTSNAGSQFYLVSPPGADWSFLATRASCVDATTCFGIGFGAIAMNSPLSAAQVDHLNAEGDFVKYYRTSSGSVNIALEHVVRGGVTENNIEQTLALFLLGMAYYADVVTGRTASSESPGPVMGFSEKPSAMVVTLGEKLRGPYAAPAEKTDAGFAELAESLVRY